MSQSSSYLIHLDPSLQSNSGILVSFSHPGMCWEGLAAPSQEALKNEPTLLSPETWRDNDRAVFFAGSWHYLTGTNIEQESEAEAGWTSRDDSQYSATCDN